MASFQPKKSQPRENDPTRSFGSLRRSSTTQQTNPSSPLHCRHHPSSLAQRLRTIPHNFKDNLGIFTNSTKEKLRGSKQMRGTTQFLVKNIMKQIRPMTGQWRLMTVSAPQRHDKDKAGEVTRAKDENVEPLVAFNRPPLPPLLGPLIVLSLFEMSSGDADDK